MLAHCPVCSSATASPFIRSGAATSFPESLNECDGSKLFQITMSPLKRVDVYIFNNKACSRMVRFNMVVSEAVQELVYSS